MGAQWKQAGREAAAQKKGQLVNKLVRELIVAAKMGGGDPHLNPRLAAAVEKARKSSVTRDTIERAIKKGTGQGADSAAIESVIYEGFAPNKVPVIVECLTDNRNRTAPEIRHLFQAGSLGTPGSVAWMFDHVGLIEAHHGGSALDLETVAIEAGAQTVEPWADSDVPEGRFGARFTCERNDLVGVARGLTAAQWTVVTSEMAFVAKNVIDLPSDKRQQVVDFLNALDDHDDVHRVYAALK